MPFLMDVEDAAQRVSSSRFHQDREAIASLKGCGHLLLIFKVDARDLAENGFTKYQQDHTQNHRPARIANNEISHYRRRNFRFDRSLLFKANHQVSVFEVLIKLAVIPLPSMSGTRGTNMRSIPGLSFLTTGLIPTLSS